MHSSRRLRLLAGCLTALVLSCTIAACSGSGSGSGGSSSGVVPRSALGVVLVDTRSGKGSQRDQLLADLGRVPAFALAGGNKVPTNQQLVDELMRSASASHRLRYDRDIKPWLGDHAGAALLDFSLSKAQKPEVGFVFFADSTNDARARTTLERAIGSHAEGSAHGAKISSGLPDAHAGSGTRAYWSVDDGHVVLSTHRADVAAALGAVHGTALEQTTAWDDLTAKRDGSGPLFGVVATPRLFQTYGTVIKQAAAASPALARQLGSMGAQTDAVSRIESTTTFRIGASRAGLWLDASTRGGTLAAAQGTLDTSFDPLTELKALPSGSALALAARGSTSGPDAVTMGYVRSQFAASDSMLKTLAASDPQVTRVRGLLQALTKLTSPAMLAASRKAFDPSLSLAVVEDHGRLGLYGKQGTKDPAAAEQVIASQVAVLDAALRPFRLRLAISGGAGSAPAHLTLSGIPAGRLRAAIAKQGDTKVLARPLAAEWLVPSITIGIDPAGGHALAATAPAGIARVPTGTADSLAGSEALARDLKAVHLPHDVDALFWANTSLLAGTILDTFSPQLTPVVTGQTGHVGGPLAWSTHSGSGKDARSHFVLELPLYE